MKKIGTKLTVRILLMLTVAVLLCTSISCFNNEKLMDDTLNDLCDNSLNVLELSIAGQEEQSKVIAETLSKDDELSKAISANNSERISKVLSELVFENRFNVKYITITDADGNVILRSYNDETGDSIINQSNVSEALKGNITTVTAEGTLIKLAVRTGAPVKWNKEVVGVVSVSYPLMIQSFWIR